MIITQEQPKFQPIVLTIETLIELEALRIAVGSLSYNQVVVEGSESPRQHYDVIVGVYKQLKTL
jgi:hypothetical protein